MTELELLLMKTAGLSEAETKDLIKSLEFLESFSKSHLLNFKLLLMDAGVSEMDADDSIDLLSKLRSCQ